MKSKPHKTESLRIFQSLVEPDCSEARLKEWAKKIAHELRPADQIFFEGPMGSGKTTFIRMILENLRIVGQPQGSPTFAIAHEYISAIGKIVHIDLFRLETFAEVEMAGLLDHFKDDPDGPIVFVEWASRISEMANQSPMKRVGNIELNFHPTNNQSRVLRIS